MGMEGYGDAASRSGMTPTDAFTLAKHVLEPEEELVQNFRKLVNREILLANISDPVLMQFEQMQIFNLCHILSMALREPLVWMSPFELVYYAWKGSLALTRAFNGKERDLMASVTGYGGMASQQGYGTPQQAIEQDEQNFFSSLSNLRKKKSAEPNEA